MLDADWWIRWLWQWWFVLGSSLVSRLRWILPSKSPLNGTTEVTDVVVEGDEQSIHVLLHGREARLHLHLMDGLLVDTPLSVEQDALWDCTMCSTNHPRSGNNSSSALTLTLLCHLLDAQVAVDGTDMQGDLLQCVDSTVDVPQSVRQPGLLPIGWQHTQCGITAGMQCGKPKNPTQTTIIGETESDVRHTFREEPIISDAVSWTCLELVFDRLTRMQQGRNLCINVNLGCVDVPECNLLTLGFPPSSDFDLVGECSSLSCFVGGSLSE